MREVERMEKVVVVVGRREAFSLYADSLAHAQG